MIDIVDRVVQYPNRYKLTPVSGDVYDLTPEAGTVTAEGTPVNKATLEGLRQDAIEASIPKSLFTAQGDMIYASAAGTPARLPKGTARQILSMNSSGTAPIWTNPPPNPISGNAVYTDFVAVAQTLTKTIPLGSSVYTRGTAVFAPNGTTNLPPGVRVDFFNISGKALVTGYAQENDITAGSAWSLAKAGYITTSYLGVGIVTSVNNRAVYIKDVYISGSNLTIQIYNSHSSQGVYLDLRVDWVVW